jgi:hypothetical protein
VHQVPPEVTWPLPELAAGADDGELRPPDEVPDDEEELDDEELPAEPDFSFVVLDELEPAAGVT